MCDVNIIISILALGAYSYLVIVTSIVRDWCLTIYSESEPSGCSHVGSWFLLENSIEETSKSVIAPCP